MKKIALISTFCDTQEKIETLALTLQRLSSLGVDTLIMTPIELPFSVIQLATYCFIDKHNPIIKWPDFCSVKYETRVENNTSFKIAIGVDEYGFAGLNQVKKMSQIALTYGYERFYHIIYDLIFDDHVINAFKSDNLTCNFWPFRRGEFSSQASLHFMVFDRENLNRFEKLISREAYLNYLLQNLQNGGAESWLFENINAHLNPIFSEEYVSDSIFYYEGIDHYDFSKDRSAKIFIQKCNENGFDVRLMVYSFGGEKRVTVKTNLGELEYFGKSPCHFTLANSSDANLSSVVVSIDGVEQEMIEDIRKIGISYFEVW
jgi:hypothetical protein